MVLRVYKSMIVPYFDYGDVLYMNSNQSGESMSYLSSPHRVWTRKCEGGERLARAQFNNYVIFV